MSRLDILFEDNHLLVLNKPANVVTQGAAKGQVNLLEHAKQYLKQKYQKPGNVFLGVVSRLDSRVTGALVLARTSKAAARLTRQFQQGIPEKKYWTIVTNRPPNARGSLEGFIAKDEPRQRMKLVEPTVDGARKANLDYRVLERNDQLTLLEVHLRTGRKHQIRLQLAGIDCPILGDRKYGSSKPFLEGIALHSRFLSLEHPTQKTRMEFTAPLPNYWPSWTKFIP